MNGCLLGTCEALDARVPPRTARLQSAAGVACWRSPAGEKPHRVPAIAVSEAERLDPPPPGFHVRRLVLDRKLWNWYLLLEPTTAGKPRN